MTMKKQPDALPTNKLTIGASVAAIVGTQASPFVAEVWPQIAPAVLAGPAATETIAAMFAALCAIAVGWFVPDREGAKK